MQFDEEMPVLLKAPKIAIATFVLILFSTIIAGAQDAGWPRQLTRPGGKLVLYQPQVDDWKNYQEVDARMAFTLTPTSGQSHVGVATAQDELQFFGGVMRVTPVIGRQPG